MNYFVDFEATQFSNEIISIGCVREDGAEFYSEVRAKKKITHFITSLTGITDEQNKAADSSDEVFTRFFDWLTAYPNERAVFYCYGNTDINFVKKNLDLTKNIKAQAALSMIGINLHDYAPTAKVHFGLVKNISLIKLVAYYRGVESVEQTHDALEDARFLKEVYDHISTESKVEGHPFPDYELKTTDINSINQTKKSPRNLLKTLKHRIDMYDHEGEVLEKTFANIGAARSYVIDNMGKIDRQRTSKNKVENKIINANNKKTTYVGRRWRIVILEDAEGVDDIADSTT